MKNRILLLLALIGALGCADEPIQEPVALSEGESPFHYPLALWDQGAEGSSLVAIQVNETGAVDSVYIAQTSGYEEFDQAALDGARKMKFVPARKGEARISRLVKIAVRFRKPGGGSPDTPPTP